MRIDRLPLDSPFVLAPLAGLTDSPMRRICRRLGASMVWSEMVSAEGIVRDGEKSLRLLAFDASERPIALQIFGARPESLRAAASRVAALGPDVVDLNAGCPAKKVVRSGSGAALMRDVGRFREAVAAVVEGAGAPVTVKIRSGWDEDSVNAVEVASVAAESGARAVAIHPRTRAQGFSGSADWTLIDRVRRAVAVPVLGSGDVREPGDAVRMLRETGCAGVMIGRGAVGNPWIFERAVALHGGRTIPPPRLGDRLELAMEHLELMVESKGERRGLLEMRKHIVAYLKGFPHASAARSELVRIDDLDRLRSRLSAILEEQRIRGSREER